MWECILLDLESRTSLRLPVVFEVLGEETLGTRCIQIPVSAHQPRNLHAADADAKEVFVAAKGLTEACPRGQDKTQSPEGKWAHKRSTQEGKLERRM